MNALVCIKPSQFTNLGDGLYEVLGRSAVEQAPGFYVVDGAWSLHRITSVQLAGQTYHVLIGHGPRAGFKALKQAGVVVMTLHEAADLGGAAGDALRGAWPYWLIDGTVTTDSGVLPVDAYPCYMAAGPSLGVHGQVTVQALVRPYVGQEVLGDSEDYDGADAGVN